MPSYPCRPSPLQIVTSTTTGYGDFYPTTWGGRVFACVCTFLGIVVIALPVTVLGTHFRKEYDREYVASVASDDAHADDDTAMRDSFGSQRSATRMNSFGNNNNNSNQSFSLGNIEGFGPGEVCPSSPMPPPIPPIPPPPHSPLSSPSHSPTISGQHGWASRSPPARRASGPGPGPASSSSSSRSLSFRTSKGIAMPPPRTGNTINTINSINSIAELKASALASASATGLTMSEADRAAAAVRRLEGMAADIQSVIRSMKVALRTHTATLHRTQAAAAAAVEEEYNVTVNVNDEEGYDEETKTARHKETEATISFREHTLHDDDRELFAL
jgi:hypothetical protein